jgi:hypothetical protein
VVSSTLAGWCDELQTPDDPAPAREPVPMAGWLLARVHSIAILADAAKCLDEITYAAAYTARVVDRPPELIYAGPCGECGHPLYAKPGRSTVTCRDHDPAWTGDVAERREWMLGKAAAVLSHAAGAVRLLAVLEFRVTAVQITRWVQAGRLTERGTDPNGRPLYRLGDLIDLAGSHDTERTPA